MYFLVLHPYLPESSITFNSYYIHITPLVASTIDFLVNRIEITPKVALVFLVQVTSYVTTLILFTKLNKPIYKVVNLRTAENYLVLLAIILLAFAFYFLNTLLTILKFRLCHLGRFKKEDCN